MHRLDINRVRHFRIGHDGGRIRIDEDDANALILQRLASLGAGIIKLTGLADHDGAGTYDQDAINICTLGHALSGIQYLVIIDFKKLLLPIVLKRFIKAKSLIDQNRA